MPVFLDIRSGSKTGSSLRLEPGRVLQVGRTARAELVFAEDAHMSGVHFSIAADSRQCRLTDLNSRNGTLVNGQRVNSALLGNGDTIVAGETTFVVRVEIEDSLLAAATANRPAPPDPAKTLQEHLLLLLRRDLQPLYAILDAARDLRILALLITYKEESLSLYEGPEGAEMAHVAPYLVRLAPESKLVEALVKEGWGKSWGVYLTSAADFQSVRRHLRHFLQVKLPDGEQVYFRFYDPRVMRVFLPTCNAAEATQFFGPIHRYVMEGEQPDELWEFTTQGRGAQKRVLPLKTPTTGAQEADSTAARPVAIIEPPGPEGAR